LILFSPVFGAETLIFMENFEDESKQILATPENNPDTSTVAAGNYVVIGGRDDGGTNFNARRIIGSDGLPVRPGGTLTGDWVFGFRDIDFPGIGPRGSEYVGEDINDRTSRLKFPNIDIAGYGHLRVELTVAAGFGAGNEPNDDIYVRARIDGGDWFEIGGFKAPSSNNIPAYYQGPADSVTIATNDNRLILGFFGDWDWPLYGHGSSLELQVTAEGNAGNEDFYVGEVRLYGDTDTRFIDASYFKDEVVEPESGERKNTLTLTLPEPAPVGGAVFSLTPLDSRSASSLTLPADGTTTIPQGQTSLNIPSAILQDGVYTGTKIVDLFVEAPGYTTEQVRVRVENVTPKPRIVFTEVMNVVPGSLEEDLYGDANNDGRRHNTQDQFAEIVNFDTVPVDLSGWRFGDDLADRHLIPDGTILYPNQVLLLFGGGTPIGSFGGATVQLPSGGGNGLGLNINSRAEIAYLNAPFGAAVDLVNLTLIQDDVIAITQELPEGHPGKGVGTSGHMLTKDDPFDYGREFGAANLHSTIAGASQRLFSPGTWFDGTPFFDPENTITLTVEPAVIMETAGANAATGTITLAEPAGAGGYDVTLITNGVTEDDGVITPIEIVLDALVINVPEGQTEVTFNIGAFDDGVLDGDKIVSFDARGGIYALTGFATLTVEDVAVSDLNVVVNEMMTNVTETGTDYNLDGLTDDELGDQYVEVVNNSGRAVDIGGWRLTWDTGGTFAAERAIHTYPEGTFLLDGASILVFGVISDENAADPSFGGALVQTAMNPDGSAKKNGLDMRIDSDFDIKLFNQHGFLVNEIVEIAETSINQGMALTRSPDSTGELALHLEVSPSFLLASPGAMLDGIPFAGNGEVWFTNAFVLVSELDSTGDWTYDPIFGWMSPHTLVSDGGGWMLMLNHNAWWYVAGDSVGGTSIWVWDDELGEEWLFTNYVFYPWMYKDSTQSWFIRE